MTAPAYHGSSDRRPSRRGYAGPASAAGKPYHVMMVAVMRKPPAILNAMVEANRPWAKPVAQVT